MPSPVVIGIIVVVLCAVLAVGIWAAVTYGGGSSAPAPGASPAPAPASAAAASGGGASPPPPPPSGAAPPPPPAGSAVNWQKKDNVAHYLGDSQYAAKTIGNVSGDVESCKTQCNANPSCTHFNQAGNSCKLFSGGEWVGSQPGSTSYCKSQCQT
jgi:hypothetical protein